MNDNKEKIYIGTIKKGYTQQVRELWSRVDPNWSPYHCYDGEEIFLQKHTWECGWYWGVGYLVNDDIHDLFKSIFLETGILDVYEIFENPIFTRVEWKNILNLMIQAYALQKSAEVYQMGEWGLKTEKGVTDVIESNEMSNRINQDLEILLDTVWTYMENCVQNNFDSELTPLPLKDGTKVRAIDSRVGEICNKDAERTNIFHHWVKFEGGKYLQMCQNDFVVIE